MKKQEIEFRDPVVQKLVNKFVSRSDVGFEKYGVTLRDDKSNLDTWLNHTMEELMDMLLYMQKTREVIKEDMEDYMWNLKVTDDETL
tara:strand:+ start:438 stop:698 length:261 start_codon:yes stop_codon:yes gene_type:complete